MRGSNQPLLVHLQRMQSGEVSTVHDFTIADGQHGEGIYCFFRNDRRMIDYYTKNDNQLHTFSIERKWIADFSKMNLDYWQAKKIIYNNPKVKAFIFKHRGKGIPTSKEVVITNPSIIIM